MHHVMRVDLEITQPRERKIHSPSTGILSDVSSHVRELHGATEVDRMLPGFFVVHSEQRAHHQTHNARNLVAIEVQLTFMLKMSELGVKQRAVNKIQHP